MYTPQMKEQYSLDRDGHSYKGIAFDGCHFYLTSQNIICVYDFCMRKIKDIKTCRCFTSICYDSSKNCFWALSENDCNAYKLDQNLQEVDCLSLPHKYGKPTSISCGENNSELLIAAGNNIFSIFKSDSKSEQKINCIPDAVTLCVSGTDDGYLFSGIFNYGNIIRHCSSSELSCGILLPEGYVPVAMAKGCYSHEIFLLIVKNHCYYRVIRCTVECCKCCKPSCDKHCESCGDDDCKESYMERELSDIIESIALSETALSNIINAEADKLQRILELTCDPEVILETNKSISKVISKVTHLEFVLFDKLQAVQEIVEDN